MRQVTIYCCECGGKRKVAYTRATVAKWCLGCARINKARRESARSRRRRDGMKDGNYEVRKYTWLILSDPGPDPFRPGSELNEFNIAATLEKGYFNTGMRLLRRRSGWQRKEFTVRGKKLKSGAVYYKPDGGRIIKCAV